MSEGCDTEGGQPVLVHGTAIALGERGILIRGRSGLGKSDLALRAVCSPRSGVSPDAVTLVSDDQVLIEHGPDGLIMSAPQAIHGKLEVRGVGLVDLSRTSVAQQPVPLVLAVDLVRALVEIERLPDPATAEILGNRIAVIRLYPFEASAVWKLRLAAQVARP